MGSKIARTKAAKKGGPNKAALPIRSAERHASAQTTFPIPRQEQNSPSQIWAKFAELEKTKASSPAQFLERAVLVSQNTTNPNGSPGSGARPNLEQSRNGTPSASIKHGTTVPGNVSNNPIATAGTVHSKNSLDTKVHTETPQTASLLPAECKKAPEIHKYYSVVNDEEALQEFMSIIDMVDDYNVDIFVDTEGENGLGKDFNLNCITIKMVSQDHRWLLDPMALSSKLFDAPAKTGKKRTLRQIFEDDKIPVVFFDVRADSNAIHGHFGVHLGGVIDLQVMEMVTRSRCPSRRDGLNKCIKALPNRYLSTPARNAFLRRKNAGSFICSGPDGYGAFNQRPLPRVLEEYAVNDVENMPELFNYLSEERGLCNDREKMQLTLDVSKEMVDLSLSPEFDSQDPDNCYGPKSLTDLWSNHRYYDDWDLY